MRKNMWDFWGYMEPRLLIGRFEIGGMEGRYSSL